MTEEEKRKKALNELAQAALEWYEATEDLGYVRDEDRKHRKEATHGKLREVIRMNWDVLHRSGIL